MIVDPKGYYAELGLSPSSTVEEIKSVYRALAKIYHPDMNDGVAASVKFRRITEAYEVLSDPVKRRAYDQPTQTNANRHAEAPPRPSARKAEVEFVHCSVCGKVAAQPRFLVFQRVTSILVMTFTNPNGGVFCSECAPRAALRASTLTALFGWWGIPWGPIRSIGAIVGNAFGGTRNLAADEAMQWQNALAFLQRGNLALAGSIALLLRGAANSDIASAARQLVDYVGAAGVPAQPLRLSSFTRPFNSVLQLLLGAAVPVLAVLLYLQWSAPTRHYSAPAPSSSTASPSLAPSNQSTRPRTLPELVPKLCATPPANNAVLTGAVPYAEYGHKLTISNGYEGDAIVKVRNAFGGGVVVSFYVARGRSASIDGLPDGSYKIQFAYGDALAANCRTFLNPSASEFPEIQTLRKRLTSTSVYTQELSFTLFGVTGGNVRPEGISSSAFDAP